MHVIDELINFNFIWNKAVDFICDHPDIKAISFVGSDQAVKLSQKSKRLRYKLAN
jgi:acyl-CoA reductase-like NAD-dependent aldehyde dehydrogenase